MTNSIAGLKILVIEDDDTMCAYVLGLLKRLGIENIQQAVDGQSGLDMVSHFRPDIVLTDVHMSPMNGLDFVQKLRQHSMSNLRTTPVLMMSADQRADTVNESASMGIVGYIVKPPKLVELRSKLEQALKAYFLLV